MRQRRVEARQGRREETEEKEEERHTDGRAGF
jgi:hypothetical protein